MALRVLVSDDLSAEGVAIMRKAGLEVDVRVGLKPEELERIVGGYDALAVRSATKVTARILAAATRLKAVGRAGVGVDNVDLEAATRRGVVVMNTPGGSSITVAELTLAHMLALARHVAQATASVKAGKWEKKRFQGHELAGKTLGVVGIGNIGSVVVSRCQSLGMRVIAYDPFVSPEAASKIGVTLVSLDDIWARSDVVSLHVPLTEQTRNLVNAQTLARMKKEAFLVNCARGGVIDEGALAQALAQGTIAGAALDVFEKEPVAPDNPLLKLDNFICTPHLGASTEEAQAAVAVAIAEQLATFLTQGVAQNALNLPAVPRETLERVSPYLSLAQKLGALAAQLVPEGATDVRVATGGDLSTAPPRPITSAVLKGLLRHVHDAPVNDVSAPAIAKERGLAVHEERAAEAVDYASLLTVTLRGKGAETVVSGTVYGKQEARIVRVNQYRLEAVPEGDLIFCENDDAPGVVGNLGLALGQAGVNIANIFLSRDVERKGAVSLINVDSAPSAEVLEKLRKLPHVRRVTYIRL
jgi:D-3-phosphoglycerate dehydrogenase/(S)-sulfolactate dehydrogenase